MSEGFVSAFVPNGSKIVVSIGLRTLFMDEVDSHDVRLAREHNRIDLRPAVMRGMQVDSDQFEPFRN